MIKIYLFPHNKPPSNLTQIHMEQKELQPYSSANHILPVFHARQENHYYPVFSPLEYTISHYPSARIVPANFITFKSQYERYIAGYHLLFAVIYKGCQFFYCIWIATSMKYLNQIYVLLQLHFQVE